MKGKKLKLEKGKVEMRFMVIVKADKNSEAGVMPSKQLLTDMGKFNEELAKAGVMVAGEGLQPSSKGARVKFSGGQTSVIDGPFAETKELVSGFWIIVLLEVAVAPGPIGSWIRPHLIVTTV